MIRRAKPQDRQTYMQMADEFYQSEAVAHKVPRENFGRAFDEAMRSDVYANIYMLETDDKAAGYALTATSYSQEAGGRVVWLDEIYIRPEFRGAGLGREFFAYMETEVPAARYRLEVAPNNGRAKSLYARLGYEPLPYEQLIKETKN